MSAPLTNKQWIYRAGICDYRYTYYIVSADISLRYAVPEGRVDSTHYSLEETPMDPIPAV